MIRHLFCALAAALFALPAMAATVDAPLTLQSGAPTVTYRVDLNGLGLTGIRWIELEDDATGLGGSANAGFDVDAIILDSDGDLLTTGDQFTASSYAFTPGASGGAALFGTDGLGNIDPTFATLDVFDGVPGSNPSGFLSMGSGGILRADFNPGVPLLGTLFLMAPDVGASDRLSRITISDMPAPVPLPAGVLLLGSGLAGFGLWRRKV